MCSRVQASCGCLKVDSTKGWLLEPGDSHLVEAWYASEPSDRESIIFLFSDGTSATQVVPNHVGDKSISE